jgi:DNA-directed RNA polymerase beta' subunit
LQQGKKNALSRLIMDNYNEKEAGIFLANVQRIACHFNMWNGFTFGVGDTDVSDKIIELRNDYIKTKKVLIQKLITETENNPNLMNSAFLEKFIYNELEPTINDVGEYIVKELAKTNKFRIIMNSGATASKVNLAQVCGTVGQINKKVRSIVNNASGLMFSATTASKILLIA